MGSNSIRGFQISALYLIHLFLFMYFSFCNVKDGELLVFTSRECVLRWEKVKKRCTRLCTKRVYSDFSPYNLHYKESLNLGELIFLFLHKWCPLAVRKNKVNAPLATAQS